MKSSRSICLFCHACTFSLYLYVLVLFAFCSTYTMYSLPLVCTDIRILWLSVSLTFLRRYIHHCQKSVRFMACCTIELLFPILCGLFPLNKMLYFTNFLYFSPLILLRNPPGGQASLTSSETCVNLNKVWWPAASNPVIIASRKIWCSYRFLLIFHPSASFSFYLSINLLICSNPLSCLSLSQFSSISLYPSHLPSHSCSHMPCFYFPLLWASILIPATVVWL